MTGCSICIEGLSTAFVSLQDTDAGWNPFNALPLSLLNPLNALNLSAASQGFGSHLFHPPTPANLPQTLDAAQNATSLNTTDIGTPQLGLHNATHPFNFSQPLVAVVNNTVLNPDDGNPKYKLPVPLNTSQPVAATVEAPANNSTGLGVTPHVSQAGPGRTPAPTARLGDNITAAVRCLCYGHRRWQDRRCLCDASVLVSALAA